MDWSRLADEVVARRAELGLSQDQLAERANVAQPTISAIETGKPGEGGAVPRRGTLAKLEHGLRWRTGSIRAILDGGGPTPLAPAPKESSGPDLHDEVEEELWGLKRLSDDEKWTFILLHRALLEKERQAAIRRTG